MPVSINHTGEAGQASTGSKSPHSPDASSKEINVKSHLHLVAYPAIVVLSLAAAMTAHAESPTADDSATQVWSQTKTSEQVRAELMQARADGTTKVWSISYNPLRQAKSLKSREQVRAELMAHRAAENGNAMIGEDSGSFYLAQRKPAGEAAPVLAKAPR